jgi:hypothetical protein
MEQSMRGGGGGVEYSSYIIKKLRSSPFPPRAETSMSPHRL